jgi:hypothetical protein
MVDEVREVVEDNIAESSKSPQEQHRRAGPSFIGFQPIGPVAPVTAKAKPANKATDTSPVPVNLEWAQRIATGSFRVQNHPFIPYSKTIVYRANAPFGRLPLIVSSVATNDSTLKYQQAVPPSPDYETSSPPITT